MAELLAPSEFNRNEKDPTKRVTSQGERDRAYPPVSRQYHQETEKEDREADERRAEALLANSADVARPEQQMQTYHDRIEAMERVIRSETATEGQRKELLSAISGAITLMNQFPEYQYRIKYYEELRAVALGSDPDRQQSNK